MVVMVPRVSPWFRKRCMLSELVASSPNGSPNTKRFKGWLWPLHSGLRFGTAPRRYHESPALRIGCRLYKGKMVGQVGNGWGGGVDGCGGKRMGMGWDMWDQMRGQESSGEGITICFESEKHLFENDCGHKKNTHLMKASVPKLWLRNWRMRCFDAAKTI